MPKSRQELVHQAMRELGVLPEGQPIPFEAYNGVDRHVDGTIDELREREVVNIQTSDVIEDRYFQPLAVILADRSKSAFGRAGDEALELDALRSIRHLQAMTQIGPTFEPFEIQDF